MNHTCRVAATTLLSLAGTVGPLNQDFATRAR